MPEKKGHHYVIEYVRFKRVGPVSINLLSRKVFLSLTTLQCPVKELKDFVKTLLIALVDQLKRARRK